MIALHPLSVYGSRFLVHLVAVGDEAENPVAHDTLTPKPGAVNVGFAAMTYPVLSVSVGVVHVIGAHPLSEYGLRSASHFLASAVEAV